MTARKIKPVLMWAGFVGDRLSELDIDTGLGGFGDHTTRTPAVFVRRVEARAHFCDVRRVEIREVRP